MKAKNVTETDNLEVLTAEVCSPEITGEKVVSLGMETDDQDQEAVKTQNSSNTRLDLQQIDKEHVPKISFEVEIEQIIVHDFLKSFRSCKILLKLLEATKKFISN